MYCKLMDVDPHYKTYPTPIEVIKVGVLEKSGDGWIATDHEFWITPDDFQKLGGVIVRTQIIHAGDEDD